MKKVLENWIDYMKYLFGIKMYFNNPYPFSGNSHDRRLQRRYLIRHKINYEKE